jgi:hypothetical protein
MTLPPGLAYLLGTEYFDGTVPRTVQRRILQRLGRVRVGRGVGALLEERVDRGSCTCRRSPPCPVQTILPSQDGPYRQVLANRSTFYKFYTFINEKDRHARK